MSRNIRVCCFNLSAFATVCFFFSPVVVQAQGRSLTGGNQGGGNQSNTNLNSAGQSTLSLGAGSLDSSSGQGLGAFTQQAGGGTPGNPQQGGFIGRGSNENQFIGRGGAQTGQSQLQRNNFSQSGRNRNAGGGGNRGGGRAGSAGTQRVIRPRLRIAFAYPKPSLNLAVTTLTSRFTRLNSRIPTLSGVRIKTGTTGEVTLQGTVNSAKTRKLAEIMARMQPGVRKVHNQLSVSADASQP